LEFEDVGFWEGRKVREPRKKNPLGNLRTNNKLNPQKYLPQIDPGPHCWKASALTIVPSLLPMFT